jgi:hypothetical protein
MFLDRNQYTDGDLYGFFFDNVCKSPVLIARPVAATVGMQGATTILQPFQF